LHLVENDQPLEGAEHALGIFEPPEIRRSFEVEHRDVAAPLGDLAGERRLADLARPQDRDHGVVFQQPAGAVDVLGP
jgi:hypothetical protein